MGENFRRRVLFKESALGRFFHRVAMSVYIYIYMSPFHVIFLRGIRQALVWNKTGLHVWSLKNGGLGAERPLRGIRQALARNKTGSCVE